MQLVDNTILRAKASLCGLLFSYWCGLNHLPMKILKSYPSSLYLTYANLRYGVDYYDTPIYICIEHSITSLLCANTPIVTWLNSWGKSNKLGSHKLSVCQPQADEGYKWNRAGLVTQSAQATDTISSQELVEDVHCAMRVWLQMIVVCPLLSTDALRTLQTDAFSWYTIPQVAVDWYSVTRCHSQQ